MEMDDDMSSMNMSFSFTCDVGELVFGWWTVNTCLAFYLSCIPVILLSVARHWAFAIATSTATSSKKGSGSRNTALLDGNGFENSSGRPPNSANRWTRFVWTMVSTTGAALSLLSMLVVMTYNSGLFLAVLVGEAIGFWVWGNHSLPEAMRGCH
ncbi:unnamed protein product [Ectocarpus sp. 4 AP-2014]